MNNPRKTGSVRYGEGRRAIFFNISVLGAECFWLQDQLYTEGVIRPGREQIMRSTRREMYNRLDFRRFELKLTIDGSWDVNVF